MAERKLSAPDPTEVAIELLMSLAPMPQEQRKATSRAAQKMALPSDCMVGPQGYAVSVHPAACGKALQGPRIGAGLQPADGGQSNAPGLHLRQLWLSLYCERWHRSILTDARPVRRQACQIQICCAALIQILNAHRLADNLHSRT